MFAKRLLSPILGTTLLVVCSAVESPFTGISGTKFAANNSEEPGRVKNCDFECRDGSNCVKWSLRCNGLYDCDDGSDEESCDTKCLKPFLQCKDMKGCYPPHWRCDGKGECLDGSDEEDCDGVHPEDSDAVVCPEGNFRCHDGYCIPMSRSCDGLPDCLDGSDEMGCSDHGHCDPAEFQCNDLHCIPRGWVCNGEKECLDGSDEDRCTQAAVPPSGCVGNNSTDPLFRCWDKSDCLAFDKVCDGNLDCSDGSDEGGFCRSACEGLDCHHGCQALPTEGEGRCTCEEGYRLKEDGKTCMDVDECKIFGSCSQVCTNLPGSHKCSCLDGYVLDGFTCKVDKGSATIFLSERSEVRRLDLGESSTHSITNTQQGFIVDMAYDTSSDRLYWSFQQRGRPAISSCKLDGSDERNFLDFNSSFLDTPNDIAIDHVAGNLYFVDNRLKHVGVCGMQDGRKFCTHVLSDGLDEPKGLALAHDDALLFYTDIGASPKIGRAAMDGSDHLVIVHSELAWPNGITVDVPLKRIYWANAASGTIESSKFDGTGRIKILKDTALHPYSIAVFEDTLFFSDWRTKTFQSCNKFNNKDHVIVMKVSEKPLGVHIHHPMLEPEMSNPCERSGCSHLCLRKGPSGFSCKCSLGFVLDHDDGVTCDLVSKDLDLPQGAILNGTPNFDVPKVGAEQSDDVVDEIVLACGLLIGSAILIGILCFFIRRRIRFSGDGVVMRFRNIAFGKPDQAGEPCEVGLMVNCTDNRTNDVDPLFEDPGEWPTASKSKGKSSLAIQSGAKDKSPRNQVGKDSLSSSADLMRVLDSEMFPVSGKRPSGYDNFH